MNETLEHFYFSWLHLHDLVAGLATRVNFHVTVMSLDSINEGSMVSNNKFSIERDLSHFADVCCGHILWPGVE